VKGLCTYAFDWFRDWNDDDTGGVSRAVTEEYPVHIEGEWFADSHAVCFELSGDAGPVTVHGIAVETQPRRDRYHVA
jgi:hypothetical protein